MKSEDAGYGMQDGGRSKGCVCVGKVAGRIVGVADGLSHLKYEIPDLKSERAGEFLRGDAERERRIKNAKGKIKNEKPRMLAHGQGGKFEVHSSGFKVQSHRPRHQESRSVKPSQTKSNLRWAVAGKEGAK